MNKIILTLIITIILFSCNKTKLEFDTQFSFINDNKIKTIDLNTKKMNTIINGQLEIRDYQFSPSKKYIVYELLAGTIKLPGMGSDIEGEESNSIDYNTYSIKIVDMANDQEIISIDPPNYKEDSFFDQSILEWKNDNFLEGYFSDIIDSQSFFIDLEKMSMIIPTEYRGLDKSKKINGIEKIVISDKIELHLISDRNNNLLQIIYRDLIQKKESVIIKANGKSEYINKFSLSPDKTICVFQFVKEDKNDQRTSIIYAYSIINHSLQKINNSNYAYNSIDFSPNSQYILLQPINGERKSVIDLKSSEVIYDLECNEVYWANENHIIYLKNFFDLYLTNILTKKETKILSQVQKLNPY